MSKTITKTAPKAAPVCPGCEDKAGGCADCAPVTPVTATTQTEAQAIPTPSAGGRYMRAEDGTLTPIKE